MRSLTLQTAPSFWIFNHKHIPNSIKEAISHCARAISPRLNSDSAPYELYDSKEDTFSVPQFPCLQNEDNKNTFHS